MCCYCFFFLFIKFTCRKSKGYLRLFYLVLDSLFISNCVVGAENAIPFCYHKFFAIILYGMSPCQCFVHNLKYVIIINLLMQCTLEYGCWQVSSSHSLCDEQVTGNAPGE